MDPNAAYTELLSVIEEGTDIDRLRELYNALNNWLGDGGFEPDCFNQTVMFKAYDLYDGF